MYVLKMKLEITCMDTSANVKISLKKKVRIDKVETVDYQSQLITIYLGLFYFL